MPALLSPKLCSHKLRAQRIPPHQALRLRVHQRRRRPPSISSICPSRMIRGPGPHCERWVFRHSFNKASINSLCQNLTLILISTAAMIAALASNIQNRMSMSPTHVICQYLYLFFPAAVVEMEEDLPATPSQFSLSISIFILTQGLFPLIWTAISEVKGRKVRFKSLYTRSHLMWYCRLSTSRRSPYSQSDQ